MITYEEASQRVYSIDEILQSAHDIDFWTDLAVAEHTFNRYSWDTRSSIRRIVDTLQNNINETSLVGLKLQCPTYGQLTLKINPNDIHCGFKGGIGTVGETDFVDTSDSILRADLKHFNGTLEQALHRYTKDGHLPYNGNGLLLWDLNNEHKLYFVFGSYDTYNAAYSAAIQLSDLECGIYSNQNLWYVFYEVRNKPQFTEVFVSQFLSEEEEKLVLDRVKDVPTVPVLYKY